MLSECCETGMIFETDACNVSFLYPTPLPPEKIQKTTGFVMFLGDIEGERWVHQSLKSLRINKVDGPENRKSFDSISNLCSYLQQKTQIVLKFDLCKSNIISVMYEKFPINL